MNRISVFAVLILLVQGGAVTAAQVQGGALDVRIHPDGRSLKPPAELLLTDPAGRMTGRNPRMASPVDQIPGSSYESEAIDDDETGAPGPETRIIYIQNPQDGMYRLRVIGTDSERYSLEIRGCDREMANSDEKFLRIPIRPGAEHEYEIRYTAQAGSRIEVRRKAAP